MEMIRTPEEIRRDIDTIDSEIVELFNRRFACSVEMGRAKKTDALPIRNSEREAAIIRHLEDCANPLCREVIPKLYKIIFEHSRSLQQSIDTPIMSTESNAEAAANLPRKKLQCGLLGKDLKHSYSPMIHQLLGDYDYFLYEKEENEVEDFIRHGDWDGLNVTIPYKKSVIPYLDELSDVAAAIGAVNTIVRRPDGTLYGDNTDVTGFDAFLTDLELDFSGKKVLVLGTGGASAAVCYVLKKRGIDYVIISRSGENNYNNLERHRDTAFLINATPVGMYPTNFNVPIDPKWFPNLEFVIDLIYNPDITGLMYVSNARGVRSQNGLTMLIAQAKASAELFTGQKIANEKIHEIRPIIREAGRNIILIGMPGSGKSTIAKAIGKLTGRPVYDSDEDIKTYTNMTPAEIIREHGEDFFRECESEVLKDICKHSGAVIATGGGCVTVGSNAPLLHQNGTVFRIDRNVELLSRLGRPLNEDLHAVFKKRDPLYAEMADFTIENNHSLDRTLSVFKMLFEKSIPLTKRPKILVINGPNINLLGTREPEIYGERTYEDLCRFMIKTGRKYNMDVDCNHSNYEGDIITIIQNAVGHFDGLIINPAAYTHTSIAILDTLKAVQIPTVEVHLTDIDHREDYRKIAYLREACIATFAGEGFASYEKALKLLHDVIAKEKENETQR